AVTAAPAFDLDSCAVEEHRPLSDGSGWLLGQHADVAAAVAAAELDHAVGGRKQRVVAAEAGTVAGVELGAALANDDRAGGHRLARKHLHAEPLGVGVAPVLGRPKSLLMRHSWSPPQPPPAAPSCATGSPSWPAPHSRSGSSRAPSDGRATACSPAWACT